MPYVIKNGKLMDVSGHVYAKHTTKKKAQKQIAAIEASKARKRKRK